MIYVDPTGLFQSEANEGDVSQYSGEGDDYAGSGGDGVADDGPDTTGFDGATGMVVMNDDGSVTVHGPGRRSETYSIDVDMPSLNAFQMGAKASLRVTRDGITIGRISALSGLTVGVAMIACGFRARNGFLIKSGLQIFETSALLSLIEFGFKRDTSKIPIGGVADWGVAFDVTKGVYEQINAP